MKRENPFKGLSLFEVRWTCAEGYEKRHNIPVGYYGNNGMVYAWDGFTDDILAKAGGGGYDKIGTALLAAVEKLTSKEIDANGAAGVGVVKQAAALVGITIEPRI